MVSGHGSEMSAIIPLLHAFLSGLYFLSGLDKWIEGRAAGFEFFLAIFWFAIALMAQRNHAAHVRRSMISQAQ